MTSSSRGNIPRTGDRDHHHGTHRDIVVEKIDDYTVVVKFPS
jgi:hypothetical protein